VRKGPEPAASASVEFELRFQRGLRYLLSQAGIFLATMCGGRADVGS